MAWEIPLRLPLWGNLLSQCLPDKGVRYHTNLVTLQLMAWKCVLYHTNLVTLQLTAWKRVLYHTNLVTPVDSMEAEWHALQDKGFSDAAIRTILAATRDTSQKVYNGRWDSFASWCSKRGQNPVRTSVK